MAATNTTANLELSQFVGSDKPDWLTDYNGDMQKIDSAYGAVNATAEQAASNAQAAATSAAAAAEDAATALSGISGAIEAAQAATTAAEQATSAATSAVSIANGAAATAQSAAGDATTALSVANNAKVTAENAQAAAAQAATDAAASATAASTAQAAATQAATDAASAAAIASGVDSRVTAIEECVPSNASASNKFATAADIPTDAPDFHTDLATLGLTAASTVIDLLSALYTTVPNFVSRITEKSKMMFTAIGTNNEKYAACIFTIGSYKNTSSDKWIFWRTQATGVSYPNMIFVKIGTDLKAFRLALDPSASPTANCVNVSSQGIGSEFFTGMNTNVAIDIWF